MKRGMVIILVFVLVAAGLIGANVLLTNQPPLSITLAVDPLAEAWARQAVEQFNASTPRLSNSRAVQATLTVVDDMSVWRERVWSTQNHPNLWLASASLSVEYARASGVTVVTQRESLLKTPLMLGGYRSRLNALNLSRGLTWDDIAEAAKVGMWGQLGGDPSWQFVDMVIALPNRSTVGLATLLSAAADYHDSAQLDSTQTSDSAFRAWLSPVITNVPNYNAIGADVPRFMTITRAMADFGIAPESQWLMNLANFPADDAIVLSYPEHTFWFDFPLAEWDSASTTEETHEAVALLSAWLSAPQQQNAAVTFGLRPADNVLPADAPLFAAGASRGVQSDYAARDVVQAPSRLPDVQSLLSWFEGEIR